MLKFWALLYRLTGWYSPFARLAEYEHIKNSMCTIAGRYKTPMNDIELVNHVKIEIGLWQAKNGFTRKLNRRRFK